MRIIWENFCKFLMIFHIDVRIVWCKMGMRMVDDSFLFVHGDGCVLGESCQRGIQYVFFTEEMRDLVFAMFWMMTGIVEVRCLKSMVFLHLVVW